LFLLTGSAGSGKTATLLELSSRMGATAAFDLDDLRPPAGAPPRWWADELEAVVLQAIAAQEAGRDTILAGWSSLDDLLATPSAPKLQGVAACLLDCRDDLRVQRIAARVASGRWREHTDDEIEDYIAAAAEMRAVADDRVFVLETSELDVTEVANAVQAWIAERP
jgi:hypothetical protein